MNDSIVLTQRGWHYVLGRGPDFYGIWELTSTDAEPLERFPLDTASWYRAWDRFQDLERGDVPIPDAARPGPWPTGSLRIAAALGFLGVLLGIIGLFPTYLDGSGLSAQNDEVVVHAIYFVAWLVSAALLLGNGRLAKPAAMFGAGLSAITFGFFLTDAGTALSGTANPVGAGLYLGLAGWLLCALGSARALWALRTQSLGQPAGIISSFAGAGIALAVGIVVTFAPAWDRFTVLAATSGQTETIVAGNAFSNPGLVIAGSVVVMALVIALAVVALRWLPRHLGAWLFGGMLTAMAAQVISAVVQSASATSPAQFGFSAAQASAADLRISNGFTPDFYLYCLFVAGALVLGVLFARERSASRGR